MSTGPPAQDQLKCVIVMLVMKSSLIFSPHVTTVRGKLALAKVANHRTFLEIHEPHFKITL
jgi:hypothetical protein